MSAKLIEQQDAADEYAERNPEMNVGGDHSKEVAAALGLGRTGRLA